MYNCTLRMASRLALLFFITHASAFAAPTAEIISLTGQGETRSSEVTPWSAAEIRQILESGADVRTLSFSSAALLLADQTQLRMNANAQIRLREVSTEKTRLELTLGRLWSRTKRASGALELETPAALAVVRGTDWDAQVDSEGRTTLTVLSGLIEVSNPFGQVEIGPSEEAYIEPGQAPIKRLLINPRERVQWVMANPVVPDRYQEFTDAAQYPELTHIRSLIQSGQMTAASEHLQEMELSGQHAFPVQLMLADFDLLNGELDGAEQRLERAWQRYQEPRAAARRAAVLAALDRMQDARLLLDEALEQMPGAPDLLLADADWWRLEGVTRQALSGYQLAVEHAPVANQAAAYHGLGRAEMERGDLKQARQALAAAVSLEPENPEYRGEQALEATLSYRLQEAEEHFDTTLELAPDDFVSLAGSGLLALQRGDAETARQQLLKALTIEPRFARGQVWLAVAEFQLGNRAAALDSLDRAMLADPNDPLPWQLRSIIEHDMGTPVAAIQSAREALKRLPYLKSLNQLANDSQGSANLGKVLGDFGLEHWARAYAEASSHPLWAGSHLFQANHLDSDFGRRSELFKGYLSDPTVFGAGSATPTLFAQPGQHVELQSLLWRSDIRDEIAASATLRGLSAEPLRAAWLLQGQGLHFNPRGGTPNDQYRMNDRELIAALGLKPTEEVGLFLLHNEGRTRINFEEPIDLGNDFLFDQPEYYRLRRTDGGFSYRWNADAQSWLKLSEARLGVDTEISHPVFGPQDYSLKAREQGIYTRHMQLIDEHRISFGFESVSNEASTLFGDDVFVSIFDAEQNYHMPWVAAEWRSGDWSLYTEGYWPRFDFGLTDKAIDPVDGSLIFDPVAMNERVRPDFLPRVGLTRRFGAGNALHLGYIETLQAPGSHTLSPVSLGGIPIDHQFMLPGSHSRKGAIRLNLELTPTTFLTLDAQQQRIENPRDATGYLFARRLTNISDTITRIGPREFSGGAGIVRYDANPYFGKGEIQRAGIGVDQIVTDKLAVMLSYAHTDSKHLENAYAGNRLPGFARHDLSTLATYHHGGRNYTAVGARYFSGHYLDEANLAWRKPSWSLSIGHSRETLDRNWRFEAGVVGIAQREQDPSFFMRVFRRW
ncbi:tetratricopeptide repeat protein [Nitrincola alkalilacustris]|uniref:tetratricopeptide repeat protein n=1 Tax=Nitrincola alkalilacustris TaxID=1571224 RepID=UPI00124F4376|nr:tetratricopeptide repeat protein [Nitrincola alkalilacustris]